MSCLTLSTESLGASSGGWCCTQVMDMLHNLFHRYDMLCEKHGIFKVETIGDGCVMAAGEAGFLSLARPLAFWLLPVVGAWWWGGRRLDRRGRLCQE